MTSNQERREAERVDYEEQEREAIKAVWQRFYDANDAAILALRIGLQSIDMEADNDK